MHHDCLALPKTALMHPANSGACRATNTCHASVAALMLNAAAVHGHSCQQHSHPHLHVLICMLCAVDHPFVASLYGTIQTGTHLHFLMEYCEGGELYGLLTTQPTKRLKEAHMRFYVAEVHLSPCMQGFLCCLFIALHSAFSTWSYQRYVIEPRASNPPLRSQAFLV